MPGSPPSSVTEPGTRPPDSTRSTSSKPVGRGATSPMSTSPMRQGVEVRLVVSAGDGEDMTSSSVFQLLQTGQRPTHLGHEDAQALQTKADRDARGMSAILHA